MQPALRDALAIMNRFAERTGINSGRAPRRYLWTDAFAVCNFLGLARATGDVKLRDTAIALVDQVHRVLGRHREDDERTGWLSGLDDHAGRAHPTAGGLRIGKPLPERRPDDPYDPALEWERDGQYFHYLTRWMHALDQVARVTGHPSYDIWARELAAVAHRAFTYIHYHGSPRRMFWKLSADLSWPQVPSMGQHDPLEGFVTCVQLASTSTQRGGPDLTAASADYAAMIEPGALPTDDPLGLGGLLVDAYRIAQLGGPPELEVSLLASAAVGIRQFAQRFDPAASPARRLACRELGLAIGLSAVQALDGLARARNELARELSAGFGRYMPLRDRMIECWSSIANRDHRSYFEHQDINDVMLATSLAPEGYIELVGTFTAEPARARRSPKHPTIRS